MLVKKIILQRYYEWVPYKLLIFFLLLAQTEVRLLLWRPFTGNTIVDATSEPRWRST